MNRRNALKTIGIGAGITISVGTLATMISSCNADPKVATWTPEYFTSSDANILDELSDIILPKTDTPGAKEANVIRYMDMIVKNIYKPKNQKEFALGFANFKNKLVAEQGASKSMEKKGGSDVETISATRDQLTAMLKKYLSKDMEGEVTTLLEGEAPDPDNENAANEPYYLHNFIRTLKDLSIAGYFGSELIGENHLVYQPTPGPYKGCVPLSDTGGKTYSL